MSMTTKCVLASLVVVATFGAARAQVQTPEGDYLNQQRYYNPGYGGGYATEGDYRYGGTYGQGYPGRYGAPYSGPYGGPYGGYGYGQPNYNAPRYDYGSRVTPEGDYRY